MLQFLLLSAFCAASVYALEPIKKFANITELEYNSMPPLFHLDNFDQCLIVKGDSLYCFATVQLAPKGNVSKTWRIIEEVISVPRFYRHDRLRHGICVQETCPKIPKAYYVVGNGTAELRRGISDCYSEKYAHLGLIGEVAEINCQNDQTIYEIDSVDMIYFYIMMTLIGLVIIGTTFEVRARYKSAEEYQHITNSSKARKLLTAFSLTKNLDRLGSRITSEDGLALVPIQGIRVFNMFFVVMCHTCMLLFVVPIFNPQYAENVTLEPLNMFLSNGGLIMQTSFMISALLLSFHLCQMFENKKINLSVIFMGIVNRLLRIYPMQIAMLGFSATWLRHSGSGPFFHRIVDSEFRNCRENWLLNVLFINNLYNSENICMQHTWYLSADTQLFVFGLFVMMAVINNPKRAKTIFGFLFVTGILVTFAQHYYNSYDIVFRSYPELMYDMFLNLPFWHSFYIATHHQVPCYIMGLAAGFYIHKSMKDKVKITLNKFWYTIWFIYVWVAPIATILSAAPFYEHGFSTSRLNAALYNAFSRFSFGLPILMVIIVFINGQGGAMLHFISWRPFHVLGRLTFTVYLIHVHILRMHMGTSRSLHYVSDRALIRWIFGDITICFLIATIVCLLIELPSSAIQKLLLSTEKKAESKVKNQ